MKQWNLWTNLSCVSDSAQCEFSVLFSRKNNWKDPQWVSFQWRLTGVTGWLVTGWTQSFFLCSVAHDTSVVVSTQQWSTVATSYFFSNLCFSRWRQTTKIDDEFSFQSSHTYEFFTPFNSTTDTFPSATAAAAASSSFSFHSNWLMDFFSEIFFCEIILFRRSTWFTNKHFNDGRKKNLQLTKLINQSLMFKSKFIP